jgi:TolA-binding protein
LAISALAEKGQAREAQALISGLLDRVESRAVAASLLVEYTWLALDQKQLDPAEEALRAALKIAQAAEGGAADPALAEACFFVAEGRFEEAAYDRAAELYRIASSLAGEGEWAARSLYKEGFCHLNLGREADAVRSFARLVEEHPGCELWGEGLFLLGEAHYRAERFEQAAAAFEQLLRDAPRHETVHKALFRLGLAQARLEHWTGCEAALSRLLREAPGFENAVEAELWRGRALAARRNGRGARQAFERVIALDRGVLAARARLELGRMSRADGDSEQGLSHFLKVAVLYAHEAEVSEALYLAGQCLEELGQPEQAAAQYEEMLERTPKSELAADARARLQELKRK